MTENRKCIQRHDFYSIANLKNGKVGCINNRLQGSFRSKSSNTRKIDFRVHVAKMDSHSKQKEYFGEQIKQTSNKTHRMVSEQVCSDKSIYMHGVLIKQ